MNRVAVNAEGVPLPPWKNRAASFIRKVLKQSGKKNWDLSVLFCDNAYIKVLNARYRKKDEATDVLSFNLGETVKDGKGGERFLPGDIVISLEKLRENAALFAVPEDEELRRLFIHGILHLDGMDHATNKKTEPMLLLQENILASLAGERIL